MAQIILTQLQQALRAVMAAGSEAFGDAMEETSDASRQLALMHSLAMMVGKMAEGIQQEDALAHWTRQLLEMLEDNAATVETEVPLMLQFFKAVGEMQALLGVPEEVRAWNTKMQQQAGEASPLPVRVQDAQGEGGAAQSGKPLPEGTTSFVRYARHLLAMLLPAAIQHAPDAVDHLRRLDGLLQIGGAAKTFQEWGAIMDPAQEALGLAASEWASVQEPAAYPLWGLYWGIEAALEKGEEWKEQDIPNKSRIGADYSGSLADLPGVPGKRADVALGCAIEIEQAACWLLAEAERHPMNYQRPFTRLLKEIRRQAELVMTACDDDEVTLAELQESAA